MDAGTIAFDVMDALRVCLCTALADSRGGSPCFCGVYPGAQVSADFCSCAKNMRGETGCGQAWVRLLNVYPYDQFPTQAAKPQCATPLAAVIEVGVFRCQPSLSSTGAAPGAAEQAEAVLVTTSDVTAILRAFTCCDALTNRDYVLGRWSPSSSGGCGGGTWTATVALRPLPA